MSTQIKHPLRLEIRLSIEEMKTLDELSKDLSIGKSEFIRRLLKKEIGAHEKSEQITDEQVKRFMVNVIESINNNEKDNQNGE